MLLPSTRETHDGHALRVARLGEGEPGEPLVCLHGYPDNLQIFSRLLPAVAPFARAIAFDWPGLGQSEPWTGGASPFQQADRVVKLLDAWGIRRASVLGLDMGGQPALALAAMHPERVGRLVVMNSLVLPDVATSWEIALLRRYGANRQLLLRLPRAVFWRACRTFLRRGESVDPDVLDDFWQSFQRREVREFVVRMCAGYEAALPRLATLYPTVATPTLVLWAEDDKHFPKAQAERLAAILPRAELEILGGGGHWMAYTSASQVAARLRRFLLA